MFTLDTMLLTPFGFKEAWELFPGDELLLPNGQAEEILETTEKERETSLLTMSDGSSCKVATSFLERYNIQEGDDVQLKEPIAFTGIEEEGYNVQLVERAEGFEFGAFAKYQFIPHHYLMGSIQNRKMFFEGLLFAQILERHTDDNRVYFIVKDASFAEDLLFLVRSLGGSGQYEYYYNEFSFYEVEVQLPAYFEEGVPERRISKIEPAGLDDVLEIHKEQNTFIVNDFIKIHKAGGENK